MNDIQIYQNSQFGAVRTIERDGEPWFVAADVCKILNHSNPSMAVKGLDEDERMTLNFTEVGNDERMTLNFTDPHQAGSRGGAQYIVVVNEPGLYQLILRSNKPEAKAFKRWITHEVIPSIRRHGLYATPEAAEQMLNNPDMMIKALTALKDEREKRKALEAEAALNKPKVLFSEAVASSHNSILIGDLAKLIRQNGVPVGQKRLFEILRQEGFLISRGEARNMPTQKAMEAGLMEIKETTIASPDGFTRVTKTPKITGKGQVYFINRYLGRGKDGAR